MYNKYIKRLLDILISLVGIIVLLPFLVLIFVWVKADSKGPVMFVQKRIGKQKTLFTMYKFRTMFTDAPSEVPTHKLQKPNEHITRIGGFLRRTSLDELPQLWNVLKGDMSIIGPRPALWNQDDLVAERDKYHANDVRPGLTGWAQINGRDELDIPVKARLDGEYARRVTFLFDCRCFIRTILSVMKHDGVVEGGKGEMGKKAVEP